MKSPLTRGQRSGAGIGGFVRPGGHRGGMGRLAALAGLLLLPLHVGAQGAGDLDTSFGNKGVVVGQTGSHDGARAVALQSDGKILVAGEVFISSPPSTDFALLRYLPNGKLDKTFNGTGQVTTDLGRNDYDFAHAVAVQPDGKIVVAGAVKNSPINSDDFALVRYLPNGKLDKTFGSGGRAITELGYARAIALQPDGKIVVAGSTASSPNGDADTHFALARYLPNGKLDKTFNGGGRVTTEFEGFDTGAFAMALQPDGKIVVVGFANRGFDYQDIAVLRYLPNGKLDKTFSGDGRVTTRLEGHATGAFAVALQPDGKIVVAGTASAPDDDEPTHSALALVRYKANGALDTAFGGDGWVTTRVTTEVGEFAVARAMALQLNGKIVVAGVTYTEEDPVHRDFLLARYNANGTLDTAFGDMGLATADFGGSLADARALVIQPYDGRLVAVGGASRKVALARYHAITCNDKVATRVGTLGNDTIVGTSGNDVIVGFAGNDLISGLGGNDVLCGGSGNDTLRGGGGNDLLDGDTGTDKCDGGPGSGDRTVACEQVTNVP